MEAAEVFNSVSQMYGVLHVFSMLELTQNKICFPDTITNGKIKSLKCDYIIVGGGAAGSVIANRLSEIPDYNVCLFEAGDDAPKETSLPALFAHVKRNEYLWNYTYEVDQQSQTLGNYGTNLLPLPRMLGGASNIDDYLYERAAPEDYDEWADLVKDKSWKYQNILSYFTKSENLMDDVILKSEFKKYHGTGGYLGVTRQYSTVSEKYLAAFNEIGHDVVLDYTGMNTKGYSYPFLSLANGVHQTGASSFILPVITRKNLIIIKRKPVVRISIDKQKNANGVCFLDDNNKEICVKAKKEVIITAGAINSAKLLLLSQIGPKKHLEAMKLKCLSDVPVGRNLIDNGGIALFHKTDKIIQPPQYLGPYVFPNPLFVGRASVDTKVSVPDYGTANHVIPPLHMVQYCLTIIGLDISQCQQLYEQSENREIIYTSLKPFKQISRGYVELRSSNFEHSPIVTKSYLTETTDVESTVTYMKHFSLISQSSYFKEVKASLLELKECSSYDVSNDDFYRCHIRETGRSTGGFSGTIAMGSVVDSRFQVYGIGHLRVADAGVIPIPLRASLYATTVMVAERAAEIIIEDDRKSNKHKGSKESDSGSSGESDSSSGSDESDSGSSSNESGSKSRSSKSGSSSRSSESGSRSGSSESGSSSSSEESG